VAEKARMHLQLTRSQISILTRLVRGEILWQRDLPSLGNAAYFGDPPQPLELVSVQDVTVLVTGEGRDLGLIAFRARGPGRALAGEVTELGTLYALRALKGLG
jgi:hypothetical protein